MALHKARAQQLQDLGLCGREQGDLAKLFAVVAVGYGVCCVGGVWGVDKIEDPSG